MTILMYHQVTAADPGEIHGVRVQQFAAQMRWLHGAGYQAIPLVSLSSWPKADSAPRHAVIITFDDGYQDAYTQAFPILADLGYTATVFLVAGLVGKASTWHSAAIPRMPMLRWEQIREMQRHGIAFGSHSFTHGDLRAAPAQAIELELRQSRRVIEDETGNPVASFSYPFGWENTQIRHQVRSSGYALACTYRPRYIGGPGQDLYRLQRVAILATDTLAEFEQKVRGGLHGRVSWWSHRLRSEGRRLLTSVTDVAGHKSVTDSAADESRVGCTTPGRPSCASSAGGKMHLLFIASTPPIPTSGGRTRLYNLVKQLARQHEVSVICFLQPGEGEQLSIVRPFCRRLVCVPFEGFPVLGPWRNRIEGWKRILFERRPPYARTFPVETMREPLRQLLREERFDVAVVNGLSVVELADELGDLPAVLAEENVESDIARQVWQTASDPIRWLRDWLVWHRLLDFEREWLSRFPVCTAVSEADAALLNAMSRRTQVHVVPNGVDGSYFAPPTDERSPALLLFFGVLSYPPNERGLIWFCKYVMPRLMAARPDVELEICGPFEPPSVTALGRLPGVRLTGFVPDIRPKLWQATASVVPLLVGGGTRLKILEALAAGCPVVSTTIGAAGLALESGQHLLIADGIDSFVDRLLDLLDSQEQRQQLSRAGRHAVEDRYDWSHIALALETACVQAQSIGAGGEGGPKRAE